MPGYPTRQTLRTPLQACRRAGVRRARLGRDGNPEAPVTRGARSRHARSTSTCTARRRAVRANLSGPRSPPTTRYRSRQVATVSQAEHQTPEMHDAGEHPARMCGRPLPWTEAGVYARAAGARAGRPQRASREARPRRLHPGDGNTLHRLQGRCGFGARRRRDGHPTRAAGSPMSCAQNISGGESN